MAARKWTIAQKAKQAEAIQAWQPWQNATGARTPAGKAIVSRNAYRGGTRPLIQFTRWFYQVIEHPETLTPEIVESAKCQGASLLSGHHGYMPASITKIIAKFNFSEREVAELRELAASHETLKNNLMQENQND